MPDATLRLLETLRAYGADPRADRDALHAFARLVAAPSPAAADPTWIEAVIDGALTSAPSRAEQFRHVYDFALDANGGAASAPAGARTNGALAMEGLLELPSRSRALLALSCLLGFTEAELGFIIDEPPTIARAILDATIDQVRNAASPRAASLGGRAA